MKFGRNLTASEILDQALHFRRIDDVDHAVFMGMGEPMMNLDNVLAACERLPDLGITHRRTAISTVGWIPGIDALAPADADPPRALACTPPTTRCARRSCRSTTATRWPTCSPPAGASTRPSAGWSSSST
jgi:adenine C2-methylase RlmN of 23S rRNA A2503 and tRNA A37